MKPQELKTFRKNMSRKKGRNVTQEDMAKALGVSRITYNRYENGAQKIPESIVILISYMRST